MKPYSPANHTGTRNYRLVASKNVEVLIGEIERGEGALPHSHPGIEQVCYLLEGTAAVEVAGEKFTMQRGRRLLLSRRRAAPLPGDVGQSQRDGDLHAAVPRKTGKRAEMTCELAVVSLFFCYWRDARPRRRRKRSRILRPTARCAPPSTSATRSSLRAARRSATGVSVDLAKELARRLGVPLHLIVFDAAGKVVEAGKTGDWDIAFVALDPKRAAEIAQSPPYVQIEGAYLVRHDSPFTSNDEVDAKAIASSSAATAPTTCTSRAS